MLDFNVLRRGALCNFYEQYGAGKKKSYKCKGRPKNFQPFRAQENLDQEPLHPKIFEKFSSQSGSDALAE